MSEYRTGMQTRVVPTLAAMAALAVFYVVPNVLEHFMVGVVPPFAIILFGDLLGCAAIARISGKLGFGLYAGLTAIEASLFTAHVLPITTLIWITDLVPAVMLAVWAAALVSVSSLR